MSVAMISTMQAHLGIKQISAVDKGNQQTIRHRPDQHSDAVALAGKSAERHADLQARETGLRRAGHIRSLDAVLQAVAKQARKMAGDIRAFEKNFPPFPRGSEERQRLLNSISAIRKQIARMTLPPEKGVADLAPHPVADRFEQLLKVVHAYLPDVSEEDASDNALAALKTRMESLLEFIQQKRAAAKETAFPENSFAQADGRGMFFEMIAVSVSVGQVFAQQAGWQMTVSQVHLRAL
jgi:hypothetical protein